MNELKIKVTERLISKGNNAVDVKKMIEIHFDKAVNQVGTNVIAISKFIRKIY